MLIPRGNAAPWTRFPKSASYGLDLMARVASVVLALVLLSAPAFGWPFVDDHPEDGFIQGTFAAVMAACVLISACTVRFAFNYRLEMGPHALVRHRLFASRPFAYAAISGLTAAHDIRRTSWRIEFQFEDGTDMVVFLDDVHLRDEDLLAWLASIPRRGGDAIVPVPGRQRSSNAARVTSGIFLALLMLACTAFTLVPVNQARHLAEGYPPLSQLDLTEGAVAQVQPCHRYGKGGVYLPIIVQTEAGKRRIDLRCELEPILRHGTWPHHLSVYRGRRLFDDATRQVQIDGLVVQSYSDFTAVDRHRARWILAGESMLVAATWVLALGFAASRRRHH